MICHKFVVCVAVAILSIGGSLFADPVSPATAPSHTIEFHIVADAVTANPDDLKTMEARMAPGGIGPVGRPGDVIRWVAVNHPPEFDRPGAAPMAREWNGECYIPVLTEADASMTRDSGNWGVVNASIQMEDGKRMVAFTFDSAGRAMFRDLTTTWSNRAGQHNPNDHARLAIVLDDMVVSAPNIFEPITGESGFITRSGDGLTLAESQNLISALSVHKPQGSPSPSTMPTNSGN
jgi:hypothetical protein